jgi:hypothetical protein
MWGPALDDAGRGRDRDTVVGPDKVRRLQSS